MEDGLLHTLPAGQVIACVDPAGHDWPDVHAAIEDGLLQTLPAGHALAWEEPAKQYWPSVQGLAAVDPAMQNEPAGHPAMVEVVPQKLPAGQGVGWVEPAWQYWPVLVTKDSSCTPMRIMFPSNGLPVQLFGYRRMYRVVTTSIGRTTVSGPFSTFPVIKGTIVVHVIASSLVMTVSDVAPFEQMPPPPYAHWMTTAATILGDRRSICTQAVLALMSSVDGPHPPNPSAESSGKLEKKAISSGDEPKKELAENWDTGSTTFPLFCRLVEHGIEVAGLAQYVPAGHGAACVDPKGHDCPSVHSDLLEGVAHTLPAGHGIAWVDPAKHNWPAEQTDMLAGLLHMLPAGHVTACVAPGAQ